MEIETDEPETGEPAHLIAVVDLLNKVTPPPVPEVVELVRELAEMRAEDRYRLVGDYGPELEPLRIRWAHRLDAVPLSNVMRLVHTFEEMAEQARRDKMAATNALNRDHTHAAAMDYLSADGAHMVVSWMHGVTWDHMLDRRATLSLEDEFLEYERVRRGGGDYDGECRRYIMGNYMRPLDACAAVRSARLQEIHVQVLSLGRPRFVNVSAVEREIAFWTRWEGFLVASDQQMDTTFLTVQTRQKLEELGRMREQTLDNLAWEVAVAEFEVEDIRFEGERWIALALGLHPRVGRDCPLRGLEQEITQMILDFAMLVEPDADAQAAAYADA
jgi:hypothetical protein